MIHYSFRWNKFIMMSTGSWIQRSRSVDKANRVPTFGPQEYCQFPQLSKYFSWRAPCIDSSSRAKASSAAKNFIERSIFFWLLEDSSEEGRNAKRKFIISTHSIGTSILRNVTGKLLRIIKDALSWLLPWSSSMSLVLNGRLHRHEETVDIFCRNEQIIFFDNSYSLFEDANQVVVV